MQDRWYAGQVVCRTGGMQDRWYAGLKGCRKEGIREIGCRKSGIPDWRDTVNSYRKEGFMRGGMRDRKNAGQEEARKSRCKKGGGWVDG